MRTACLNGYGSIDLQINSCTNNRVTHEKDHRNFFNRRLGNGHHILLSALLPDIRQEEHGYARGKNRSDTGPGKNLIAAKYYVICGNPELLNSVLVSL